MLERLECGDFVSAPPRRRQDRRNSFVALLSQYLICPDGETTEELDRLRMTWSATDVVANRPALSRWHPEWKSKFDEYMRDGLNPSRKARSSSRGRGGADGFLMPVGSRAEGLFGGSAVEIKDGAGRRTPAE